MPQRYLVLALLVLSAAAGLFASREPRPPPDGCRGPAAGRGRAGRAGGRRRRPRASRSA